MAARWKSVIPDPRAFRSQRASLYWTVVAAALGLGIAMSQGAMGGSLGVIWALVLVIVVLAYESLVRQSSAVTVALIDHSPALISDPILEAGTGEAACIFGSSYSDLEHQMPDSVDELIASSGEKGVAILGGTFGTFAKVEANVRALKALIEAGIPVRLLMLDPYARGVTLLADQKQQRGQSIEAVDLEREIRISLKRLHDHLGTDALVKHCRLYTHIPRNSVYCLGNAYVVTIYKFGAGASSPCIFLRRSTVTNPFCDALDSTFNDIWNAPMTRPFDVRDLREHAKVSEGAPA